MEVKPTVFAVVGFLIPGIMLLATFGCLVGAARYGSVPAFVGALPTLPEGTAVLFSTLLIGALLAGTLAAGAVLSDVFTLVARQFILRPLLRPRLRENVKRLFAHSTLEELVRADMDARESHVYLNTGGLDLGWYAGRVRMMGASGLALLVNAIVAWVLGLSWSVVLWLALGGLLAVGVALYRSNKFDEYVAAASAVLMRRGAQREEPGDEA